MRKEMEKDGKEVRVRGVGIGEPKESGNRKRICERGEGRTRKNEKESKGTREQRRKKKQKMSSDEVGPSTKETKRSKVDRFLL
jgi:hypothetical protein